MVAITELSVSSFTDVTHFVIRFCSVSGNLDKVKCEILGHNGYIERLNILPVWSQWRCFGGAVALKATPPCSHRTLVEIRCNKRHRARWQGTEQTDHTGSCNCLHSSHAHATGLCVCVCQQRGGGAAVVSGAAGESLRPECHLILKTANSSFTEITVESCLVSQEESRMSTPADAGEGSETGIVPRNCVSVRKTAIQQVCQVAPVRKANCRRFF